MALTVSQSGTNNSTSASASIDVTNVTASVGDVLLVWVAADNDGTSGVNSISSVTDSQGNTYNSRVNTTQTAGAANDGATIRCFEAVVTSALSLGTVTINFSPNTTRKSVAVWRLQPSANRTVMFIGAGAGVTGTTAAELTETATGVPINDVIFGCLAVETDDGLTGDADTTNGSWTSIVVVLADGGPDASAMTLGLQRKAVTATGDQTWNPTVFGGVDRDFAMNYVIYRDARVTLAGSGSYSVTGTAASLLRGRVAAAGAGSYSLAGTAATLTKGSVAKTLVAGTGSYAVAGTAATLVHGWAIIAGLGSYAVAGSTAGTLRGRLVSANGGSYVITGTAVSLNRGKTLTAAAGSYVVTGTTTPLLLGKRATAGAGSYAVVGTAATLIRGKAVIASAGAYTVTGSDAARIFGIYPASGSYAVAGTAASLLKFTNRTIAGGIGSYAVAGLSASLLRVRKAAADAGAYTINGTAVTLTRTGARALAVDSGVYALAGVAASLARSRIFGADAGSYSLAGVDATLVHGSAIGAEAGIYDIVGAIATLIKSGTILVAAEPGSYSITGSQAALTRIKSIPVGIGSYLIAGTRASLSHQIRRRSTRGRHDFAAPSLDRKSTQESSI